MKKFIEKMKNDERNRILIKSCFVLLLMIFVCLCVIIININKKQTDATNMEEQLVGSEEISVNYEELPIGTVVLLEGGTKEVMIYGRNIINLDSNESFDYVACMYPEGYVGNEYNIFFNSDAVVKICK